MHSQMRKTSEMSARRDGGSSGKYYLTQSRCSLPSGDGLTSVGNYIMNWTMDKTIDAIAEAPFTMYDWTKMTLKEVVESLTFIVHDKDVIKQVLNVRKSQVHCRNRLAGNPLVKRRRSQNLSSSQVKGMTRSRAASGRLSRSLRFQTPRMRTLGKFWGP